MQLCVLRVGRQPVRFGPLPPPGGTWQSNSGHQVWPRVALPTSHFIEPNKKLVLLLVSEVAIYHRRPDMVEQLTSW